MKLPITDNIKNAIVDQLDILSRGHDGLIRVVVKDRHITSLDFTHLIQDERQAKAYQERLRVSKRELAKINGK